MKERDEAADGYLPVRRSDWRISALRRGGGPAGGMGNRVLICDACGLERIKLIVVSHRRLCRHSVESRRAPSFMTNARPVPKRLSAGPGRLRTLNRNKAARLETTRNSTQSLREFKPTPGRHLGFCRKTLFCAETIGYFCRTAKLGGLS